MSRKPFEDDEDLWEDLEGLGFGNQWDRVVEWKTQARSAFVEKELERLKEWKRNNPRSPRTKAKSEPKPDSRVKVDFALELEIRLLSRSMTQGEIAKKLGLSRWTVNRVLNE